MVDRLVELGIDILFVIGGDGSMRGAAGIAATLRERNLPIGVIGIPKTIDNDIPFIGQSFGFVTAFSAAAKAINAAMTEARAGDRRRRTGPADGPALRLHRLLRRAGQPGGGLRADPRGAVRARRAERLPAHPAPAGEGTGQRGRRGGRGGGAGHPGRRRLARPTRPATGGWPTSGCTSRRPSPSYFTAQASPLTLKYFDPGYLIRSVPADPHDAVYCLRLAQAAVHAGMAGRTDMVVGRRHNRFIHVPIDMSSPSPIWWRRTATCG